MKAHTGNVYHIKFSLNVQKKSKKSASENFTDAVGETQVCGKYMQTKSLKEQGVTQLCITVWTMSFSVLLALILPNIFFKECKCF